MNDSQPNDQAPESSEDGAQSGLTATVHRIAGYLDRDEYKGGISKGDLAELRRIDPDQPYTPALWKILLQYVDNSENLTPGRERQWAVLLMAMGNCAGLHDPKTPFGTALAESGWSELRFVRLMRATDDALVKHLRRVSQYLASKGQQANWADAAWLLFVQDGEKAENIRQGIARDYYKRLYTLEHN